MINKVTYNIRFLSLKMDEVISVTYSMDFFFVRWAALSISETNNLLENRCTTAFRVFLEAYDNQIQ